ADLSPDRDGKTFANFRTPRATKRAREVLPARFRLGSTAEAGRLPRSPPKAKESGRFIAGPRRKDVCELPHAPGDEAGARSSARALPPWVDR
ncbi:MAG: hypothetical protein JJT96_15150, partial [Opitutales bacterium]|nr:hypothetical protein [Opitutales bacterium]